MFGLMKHGRSISIDDIASVLDIFPCSVPASFIIAAVSFYRARQILGPQLRFTDHILAHRWLTVLLSFVALKSTNRVLVRLMRNNGWKADPPRWSRIKGEGDVVLITGGSTGIGKEIVELLAKKTNKIVVLDMAEPTYKASGVHYYKCDVTDPAVIHKIAEDVRAKVGHPTYIINNAGIARGNTILDTTPEQFLLTYKVNVLGCHNILREFLPHIIKVNHGHIMTTASSASYAAIPQLSEYACSKAAALALHEVLTGELKHRYNAPRVRTSVICPTKVSTQMGDAMKEQDNQFMTPTLSATWLAHKMVSILESGLSDHLVTPGFARVLLPSLRSLPEWHRWIVSTVGKTHETITDEGNARQRKTYTFVDELDKQHGLVRQA
ncbi:BZ3500_MvSof-1268-A1-R1_Chr6-1g08404 [Microbotryum saponariae]|uniref:Short-chain dehydrogenase/reductase 3 n=1 Tax=Microbotryum saponariae TaxID=289078 RepID=A0A2X0MQ85_9BASI|nr:BZ3500_MvSof-1268-A1-R1_Chr6-1g08404 [Microbotryum saponariae]SDA07688.1 BZ3501_MvSof-1269-A2-R1_Chr6-1g08125 [Microbotryum saponariae]